MRYIISVSAAALMFANALCDVAANEEVKANEDVVIEDAVEGNTTSNAFNSVYLGLGIGGSFLKHSTETIEKVPEADPTKWTYGTHSPKANRVMGTLVAGAGKTFNDHFYFGGDVMLDIMKSKKKSYEYKPDIAAGVLNGDPNITFREQTKCKGFAGNIGVRFGYVSNSDVLTYFKIGGAFNKATVSLYGKSSADNTVLTNKITLGTTEKKIGSVSNSKMSPMIALGVEKMINGFSARVEGEYDFKARKGGLKRKGGMNVRFILAKHFGF